MAYFRRGSPRETLSSWIRMRDELREKIKQANRDDAEMIRFQIEGIDWLINEGSNPRTNQEIESEYQRLAKERQNATGIERVRLEARFSILQRCAPFLGTMLLEHQKMMEQSRKLFERNERLKARIENPELVEKESELIEVKVEAQNGRVTRTSLVFPREKKPRLPAIIVVHDKDGVTNHIRYVGKRLAAVGYVAAIPFLELGRGDSSGTTFESPAEDLVTIIDYLRTRPEIDKYVIGCLGFGLGGTCSLIFATKSQYVRACLTLCSDVPALHILQTDNMRAALHFVQVANDHPAVDHFNSLREDSWRNFRTSGGRNLLVGGGLVLEGVGREFFNEESSEYDQLKARNIWGSILLSFDQELLADRSTLPEDQVGIQFSKLSSGEREQYFAKMKSDPLFAKNVVTGFYASIHDQLDEDKAIFSTLSMANPQFSEERGRVAAANFRSYSENEKKIFLDLAQKDADFAEGFVGNSSVPLTPEPDREKLSPEDRKAFIELASSSSRNMRAFGRSRGQVFVYLAPQDREQTFALAKGVELERSVDGQIEKIQDGAFRAEFCKGLGEGLAFHLVELANQDIGAIRKLINEKSEFAEGLMNNLNWALGKMAEEDKSKLWNQFAWVPKFARGIGIAFGMGFARISAEARKPFLDFAEKNEYFSEGFGYGFGLIAGRLSESEKDVVRGLLQRNRNFKKGYEEALS